MPSLKHRNLFKLRIVTTNSLVVTEAILFLWRIPASFCCLFAVSINKSFELCYFGTKDSGFCRPFPSHINFNAGEYLLVGHVVSSYINLLTHDDNFLLFLLLGYVIIII